MNWLNNHAEFIKGLLAASGGIFITFLDFIMPIARALLVLVTLIYTCWKFYQDYKKNKRATDGNN